MVFRIVRGNYSCWADKELIEENVYKKDSSQNLLEREKNQNLCGQTDDGATNVLSKTGKEKKFWDIIEKLTGIMMCAKNKLPKTVCRSCQNKLSNYSKFREMCVNTQLDLCANMRSKWCKELSPTATKKTRTILDRLLRDF